MLPKKFFSKLLNVSSTLALSAAILGGAFVSSSWAMREDEDKNPPKGHILIQWTNTSSGNTDDFPIPGELIPAILFSNNVQPAELSNYSLVSKHWHAVCHPLVTISSPQILQERLEGHEDFIPSCAITSLKLSPNTLTSFESVTKLFPTFSYL